MRLLSKNDKREKRVIRTLLREINDWRDCAKYDPMMSGRGQFKGWDRSALDRCRKKYIEEPSDSP